MKVCTYLFTFNKIFFPYVQYITYLHFIRENSVTNFVHEIKILVYNIHKYI